MKSCVLLAVVLGAQLFGAQVFADTFSFGSEPPAHGPYRCAYWTPPEAHFLSHFYSDSQTFPTAAAAIDHAYHLCAIDHANNQMSPYLCEIYGWQIR